MFLQFATNSLQRLGGVAGVVAVIAVGYTLFNHQTRLQRLESAEPVEYVTRGRHPSRPAIPTSVPLRGAASRSPATAKAALLVFSDFDCPACRTLGIETLPAIERHFSARGGVSVYFKHFPIIELHPAAEKAARAAVCANRQGHFWQMHDYLFSRNTIAPTSLSPPGWAAAVNLDGPNFMACMNDPEATAEVLRDIADGERAGIMATPIIFVGQASNNVFTVRQRLAGVPPLAELIAHLERQMAGGS